MADYIPFWDDDDPEVASAWDRCVIGGHVLPGIARVKCPTRRGIDAKPSPGSDGATFTDKGKGPAQVRVTLRIITLAEWQVWLTVRPELDPQKNGGLKRPHTIDHPKTSLAKVKSIYVTGIEEDDPDAKKGMIITIDCIEWMKQATRTNSKQDPGTLESEWAKTYLENNDPTEAGNMAANTFGDAVGAVVNRIGEALE